MDLKQHENYKKTNRPNMLSRAQEKTIDFVRQLFGYKIIPENQQITFLWDDFEQYAKDLSVKFIPFYYKSYKDKKILKKVIAETAQKEAFNLKMSFLNHGFKLPTKKWKDEQHLKFDIYVECYQRALLDYILETYTSLHFTEEEIEHLKWYYFLSAPNAAFKINQNYTPINLNIPDTFKEKMLSLPYIKFDEIAKKLSISELNNKHFKFYLSQIINKTLEKELIVL